MLHNYPNNLDIWLKKDRFFQVYSGYKYRIVVLEFLFISLDDRAH